MMMLDTAALCLSFFLSLFLSFFFFNFTNFLSVNIKRFIGVSNENIHDLNPLTPIIDFIFSFKKKQKNRNEQ